jgi:hypothetical protein
MERVNCAGGRGKGGAAARERAKGGKGKGKDMGYRREMEKLGRRVGEKGTRGDTG